MKTPSMLIPRLQIPNWVKTAPKSPRMAIATSLTFHNSCGVASNFRIVTGIRNKIITLRELFDLTPCDGSESANELLISTLRDLHKLFPSINPNFSLSKIDGASIHEKVRCFCDILRSIGEMWTGNDEWMITCKENFNSKLNAFEYVLALLDDIIKLASERMVEMTDEDETEDEDDRTRETSPSSDAFEKNFSEMFSSNNSSLSSSPTSVLPEIITNASKKNAKASITSPLLLSLKVQAVGNQNPIEVKHLSFHMLPNGNQDSNDAVQLGNNVDEIVDLPEILLNSLEKASENGDASNGEAVPAPPSPKPIGKVAEPPPPPTPRGKRPAPPKSPRLAVPAPPPPMQTKMGGAPPPPPPPTFAGDKNPRSTKTATKLKRSSQMGNLYRSLKGKVEGSSLQGKQKGGKGIFNASKGDKPGMADALAEMTKRSAYFQQIEEDVKNHAKLIKEVKKSIASFQTSDMSELITFHNYVESQLEKLTDETQVLARFEDFPCKKLEALRTAATLHSKLDSIVSTLQNWQPASPVDQHLARAERYFNKIKGDVDTLDRTKDEEFKKLKTHQIQFDFGALLRIKELMVDVSSNCMELALKEKREETEREKEGTGQTNEGSKKESATQLWKAFQFAFRVYTFTGGQDERAEKLTKELAEVIETDLHLQT